VELPEDLAKLLEMIKAHIKEKGGLSSPSIDRETWEEIDALVKAIKSMNLPYSLKDIADELGVSYSSFTKYYKAYQRMIESGEQGREQPKVEVSRPMTKEGGEGKEEEAPKEEAKEVTVEAQQEQKALESATRAELLRRVRRTYIREAEPLSTAHAEMIVRLGKRFYENYGNQCIQSGYENLEDCMDEAMDALFNKMPEYEYLKEVFDKVTEAGAKLLLKLAEYAKRVQDLELIEKIVTGEIYEELENIPMEEAKPESGS
jgi:DNA-binding MarR family transcriptional regulator